MIAPNKIILGDNLPILSSMESESVPLIYIDPPFNSGKTLRRAQLSVSRIAEDTDTAGMTNKRIGFQGRVYQSEVIGKSSYSDSFEDYLLFLEQRLREAHRILTPNGSLFFHIDWREAARCRLLLESIFGGHKHCINEIIWAYDFGGRSKLRWPTKHDNIYWFAKDPNDYIFNYDAIERIPYLAPGLVTAEKAAKGKTPTDTWWHTIVPTNGYEKTGYATQKPLGIIRRIVLASSNPGDVVMDFFAGSGTLGVAAMELGRRYILIDENPQAVAIMKKRLRNIPSQMSPMTHEKRSKECQTMDKSVTHLAEIGANLSQEYPYRHRRWAGSPFEWIIKLPSRQKGKIGQQMVAAHCRESGLQVIEGVGDSEANLLIDEHRVEVKFSTLWETGIYKFQQIRDQNYEFIFFLGISPHAAHAWVFPKTEIPFDELPNQHGGKRGTDTWWVSLKPNNPPQWMRKQSGKLSEVCDVFLGHLNG